MVNELLSAIRENVAEVRRRMAAAAVRAGRRAQDVRLVAVTKYVGPAEIRAGLPPAARTWAKAGRNSSGNGPPRCAICRSAGT